MSDTLMNLAAGATSGVVCAAAGYPIETVLVLMQSHHAGATTSYHQCVTELYKHEGIAGFFKGIPPRLLASALEYSLTFAGYDGGLRLVGADEDNPTLRDVCAGGVGGGLATTAILTPLELIKCRMQVTPKARSAVRQQSPLTVAHHVSHVYRREGGLRGFYQGGVATLVRDIPGTAIWCGTNDLLRAAMTPAGCSVADLGLWDTIFCGGISGLVYAMLVYPADVVKTRMQTNPRRYRSLGFVQAVRSQYKEGGVRSFYRGFALVAAVAFPNSALLFMTYEYAVRVMTHPENKSAGGGGE